MSISRTLRSYLGIVQSSTLTGEVRFAATAGPDEAPSVGHVGELEYTVVAVIEHSDDPNVKVEFTGAAAHRPFQGIHFLTAPVGSPCRLVVDSIANTIKLDCLQEVAIFDPCGTPVAPPSGPGIVTIEPVDPVRPIDPTIGGG